MRSLLYILEALGVIALAYWAYSENYYTQDALRRVNTLQREIGEARETLSVLRTEWAYLNRPDRLRELADLNFETLGLMPLTAQHFGEVEQVIFAMPEPFEFAETIDLSADLEEVEQP